MKLNIGLIDVDDHHDKKKWGSTAYPNLALGKIARYLTESGDRVELARSIDLFTHNHYDIIYASKVLLVRNILTRSYANKK